MAHAKKRAASEEQLTPKKRRTSRGLHTSPPSHNRNFKPFNIQDAKAASEKLSQALRGSPPGAGREPSPSVEGVLQLAPRLLSAPPDLGPPEKLSSIVRKVPASGSADMDLSHDGATMADLEKDMANTARGATPATGHEEASEEIVTAEVEEAETGSEAGSETDANEVETPATETGSVNAAAIDEDTDTDSSNEETDSSETSILPGQSIDMSDDESGERPLPPAILQLSDIDDADDGRRRLGAFERLIWPAARDKIPRDAWNSYMRELERQRTKLSALSHTERLDRIKRIIFLPEEMVLLSDGDAERMICAIRLCKVAAGVLGSDEEVVQDGMSTWVDMHIRDIGWKLGLRLRAAAESLWPISRGPVQDGGDGLHMNAA